MSTSKLNPQLNFFVLNKHSLEYKGRRLTAVMYTRIILRETCQKIRIKLSAMPLTELSYIPRMNSHNFPSAAPYVFYFALHRCPQTHIYNKRIEALNILI